MAARKQRLDTLLVERGLAPTRTRAQALILAGRVFSEQQRLDKAGAQVDLELPLSVREGERFVSRGGAKLEGALVALELDVADYCCMDVGASTGGFTDCLLQRGAGRVYAIDVGFGQLAHKLRSDERVVNRERTNARHLQRDDFPEPIDLVVVDASFIGLGKLLPAIARVLAGQGQLLAMVKPQFEVGREAAKRAKGVIKDPKLREAALDKVRAELAEQGFVVRAEVDSALPGPKGNVERFMLCARASCA